MTQYGPVSQLLPRLSEQFGERLALNEAVRASHSCGEGANVQGLMPDAVLFAATSEEVVAAVRLCREYRVPIIPFGVGTSLEGQLLPVRGGITIDLSGLDRILEINSADLDCRVEAGVTREALNLALRDQGLFFPLDPGANATLGGMASTRASGTNAVRYGTMKDVTIGLTVATPDGELVRVGGRARKSSAGYDLVRLFVGAEGTLGIITELQLRLFGIPEMIAAGVCQFPDLVSAVESVTAILQVGIPIARIELLDETQMQASIAHSKLTEFLPHPTLFFELHGSTKSVADQREQISDMLAEFGGEHIEWAERQEDRTRLWTARHNAYWAGRALQPGHDAIVTDVCVPISHLPTVIRDSRADALESGFTCPIVGHVGDGNFHMTILHDSAERQEAERLADRIARRAIAVGGTATGEHGVGLYRIGMLAEEHGASVGLMRRVKQALDPFELMNPGKLFQTSDA